MKDVVIYTKDGCRFCEMTKALFTDSLKNPFVEKNVSTDPEALQEFQAKGYDKVPVIIVDGKVIVGYKPFEIMALFDNRIK